MTQNQMSLRFSALDVNEGFARLAVSGFLLPLNPTVEQLEDIKTAISEAVTNAVLHGYPDDGAPRLEKEITLTAGYDQGGLVTFTVEDSGVGIADIEQARRPLYTSRPDMERSGMGFAVMESFMDGFAIVSAPGKGTKVTLQKQLTSPEEK